MKSAIVNLTSAEPFINLFHSFLLDEKTSQRVSNPMLITVDTASFELLPKSEFNKSPPHS